MLGLINSAIEGFLKETYGIETWRGVVALSGVEHESFEPMMQYPSEETEALITAAAANLRRPREALLDDLGHWLVAARSGGRLRRLLRFGGDDFVEFLHSLVDLPARVQLALPDFGLPALDVVESEPMQFRLRFEEPFKGGTAVLCGILRSMADDYGALVLIDAEPEAEAVILVQVLREGHGTKHDFELVRS